MKRYFIFAALFFSSIGAFAQRFAYVDSEYILSSVPEYSAAQKQLQALTDQWQKDFDARMQNVDKLYKAYQADRVLLTEDMRKKRESDIVQQEKAAKDFQRQKFGPDGDLAKRSTELIKPIQDRVAKAIQATAESENLDMVFDKNSEVIMLYSNPRYDRSNAVISRMGLKPTDQAKGNTN
ncbi:MAG: OmpH family outer membrane protein [Mucilaginibacter polytrichastri]|nr:OmpH family outer membrane protein [Mucilaginibacter polytrichastri]